MPKSPTFDNITAAFASASKLNANFDAIEASFQNTVSRDGSNPNQMTADFDLNGNDLLNVGNLTTGASSSVTFKGVRVYQTVATTGITNSGKIIAFDTESYDTNSLHNNSTNNSRLVTDSAGYWVGTAQFAAKNADLYTFISVNIMLNGTIISSDEQIFAPGTNLKSVKQVTTGPLLLSSGDYLEMLVALIPTDDTRTGQSFTWFSMYRVGV